MTIKKKKYEFLFTVLRHLKQDIRTCRGGYIGAATSFKMGRRADAEIWNSLPASPRRSCDKAGARVVHRSLGRLKGFTGNKTEVTRLSLAYVQLQLCGVLPGSFGILRVSGQRVPPR